MKKLIMLLCASFMAVQAYAQELNAAQRFMERFAAHEGNYYEGKITAGARPGDGFSGQRLLMQVRSYADREVKIPFFVGEDKSRTWVFSYNDEKITLKHDHRHADGTADSITYYGGTATNSGWDTLQTFPADVETCRLIDYACQNVWWVTMDGKIFTYNLRRIGSDRVFTVEFDLSQPVVSDYKTW